MAEPQWREKASSFLEEAKTLWSKVSSRKRAPRPQEEALSSIDHKIESLRRQVQGLEEEAAASYEVVSAIAQQHSGLTEQHLQLIQAFEELQLSNRRLTWGCIALAALAAASLAFALAT